MLRLRRQHNFLAMYECMTDVPDMDDWAQDVFEELYQEEREELIEAAIYRGDDYLYGYGSRDEFRNAVWMNQVQDPALEPQVTFHMVVAELEDYIATNQMSVLVCVRHTVQMIFPVIKGVW